MKNLEEALENIIGIAVDTIIETLQTPLEVEEECPNCEGDYVKANKILLRNADCFCKHGKVTRPLSLDEIDWGKSTIKTKSGKEVKAKC